LKKTYGAEGLGQGLSSPQVEGTRTNAHISGMNKQIFLNLTDAARLLSVDIRTLKISIRDGTLPATTIGKRLVIPRAALERLAQATLGPAPDGK